MRLVGGLHEEDNLVHCKAEFFVHGDAPMKEYAFSLRFDARKIFYADAVADAARWYESFPGYRPAKVPEAAFEALYSTWYGYHQNVSAPSLEKEYALAAKLGMKCAILDDGWQTGDDHRGYAYCGDWTVAEKKFPDMQKHVAKVHALGMKYLVWFAVPFIGEKSRNYARFKGKYLYDHAGKNLHAAVHLSNSCVEIPPRQKRIYIVNASSSTKIIVSLPAEKFRAEFFDVCGKKEKTQTLDGKLREISVPISGMAVLSRIFPERKQR